MVKSILVCPRWCVAERDDFLVAFAFALTAAEKSHAVFAMNLGVYYGLLFAAYRALLPMIHIS